MSYSGPTTLPNNIKINYNMLYYIVITEAKLHII